MAAITAAAIGAGAGLIGDFMSQQGSQGANAAQIAGNELMQQRAFSFDAAQQQKAMAYDTQMSNTAIQRRAADIKAAGFNPLLAVGALGGASSPMLSGATGPGGSVGQLQNPNAALGQLGQQVTNATQTAANLNQQQAQTANTRADTAIKLAQGQYSGQQAAEQLQLTKDQEANTEQDTKKKVQDTWGAFFQQGKIQIDTMNEYQKQQFMKDVGYPLQTQLAQIDLTRAKLGLPPLENEAHFATSTWGQILNAIGFGPKGGTGQAISSAAEAARAAAAFAE